MGLFDRLKENIRLMQESQSSDTPPIDSDLQNRITEMENQNQQPFIVKHKWWFIGGGVLLVGSIATLLILSRK